MPRDAGPIEVSKRHCTGHSTYRMGKTHEASRGQNGTSAPREPGLCRASYSANRAFNIHIDRLPRHEVQKPLPGLPTVQQLGQISGRSPYLGVRQQRSLRHFSGLVHIGVPHLRPADMASVLVVIEQRVFRLHHPGGFGRTEFFLIYGKTPIRFQMKGNQKIFQPPRVIQYVAPSREEALAPFWSSPSSNGIQSCSFGKTNVARLACTPLNPRPHNP